MDVDSEEFKNELNKRLEAKLAECISSERSKWEKEFKKTAENPKEPLIAVFPRYHSMNDNMLFLDGLGDKDRNNAIITKLEVE